jgi:hypothetical protein
VYQVVGIISIKSAPIISEIYQAILFVIQVGEKTRINVSTFSKSSISFNSVLISSLASETTSQFTQLLQLSSTTISSLVVVHQANKNHQNNKVVNNQNFFIIKILKYKQFLYIKKY